MKVKFEDKVKVKQYNHEKEELEKFLVGFLSDSINVSKHVANAVEYRLRIVNRELNSLGVKAV